METSEALKRIEKARVGLAKAVVKFDKIVDAVTPLMDDELSEDRIQFIRELNATGVYSQKDLAQKFKISRGYLSRMLSGKRKKNRE
jgi:DNA-binding MarR family transcriptional regulator